MSTATTQPKRAGRRIAIALLTLVVLVAVIWVGARTLRTATAGASDDAWSAAAAGATELRISSPGSDFSVRFDDVDEARLEASTDHGPLQAWRLERDGQAIVIDGGSDWRWLDFDWLTDREEHAVLTLPEELATAGLDLTADIAAGSFTAEAEWGAVTLEQSAGHSSLSGSAETLVLDVSAGRADIGIHGADTVDLGMSAGDIAGALTGEQPSRITADASAGSIQLTIPRGSYAVTEDVSAGDATIDVVDDSSAASVIQVQVSAGSVTLRGDSR